MSAPGDPRTGDGSSGVGSIGDGGIALREAGPGDASRLSAIAYAAKAHWGYPADWLAAWRDELRVTPEDLAANRFVVADREGEVVGFLGLSSAGKTPEIEHLWVDPPAMGSGVGRRLLADALAWCRARGLSRLRVVSDPQAEGFYRHHGAERVGDVPSTPAPRRLPLLEFRLDPGGRESDPDR